MELKDLYYRMHAAQDSALHKIVCACCIVAVEAKKQRWNRIVKADISTISSCFCPAGYGWKVSSKSRRTV